VSERGRAVPAGFYATIFHTCPFCSAENAHTAAAPLCAGCGVPWYEEHLAAPRRFIYDPTRKM
jgi:hypothetical protein